MSYIAPLLIAILVSIPWTLFIGILIEWANNPLANIILVVFQITGYIGILKGAFTIIEP